MPQIQQPIEQSAARGLNGGLLFLLAGLAALGALSTNIILPSFPAIAEALSATRPQLGLTLTTFFIAFALGQLVVGPLSDRIGRRPLVIGGLIVAVVGSAVCALAHDMTTLIVGRIIQAFGVCAASVLSRAIARDLFDGPALARVLALVLVAMAAAPGFSPLIGGALNTWLGWRAAFVLVGLLAVVLTVHYDVSVGETHRADNRSADSAGAVARAYVRLGRNGLFIRPAASVGLVIGALYAFFAATPAILIGALGLSPLQLGQFFAATDFVVFGAGLLAPRLAAAKGARPITIAGFAIAFGGGILLLFGSGGTGLVPFALSVTVFLFGMGLANPVGTALALQPFGREAGLASALLGFLQMGFAAISTALVSSITLEPAASLGLVMSGAAALALLIFVTAPKIRVVENAVRVQEAAC